MTFRAHLSMCGEYLRVIGHDAAAEYADRIGALIAINLATAYRPEVP